MSDIVNGIQVPFVPIGGVNGLKNRPIAADKPEQSFENVLEKELKDIKFSKHAQQRLESRNINLSDSDMQDLSSAVDKADGKGSSESLVLLRDMAFVVSIKNRTVVTALSGDTLKENVFTNIDSAVIAG
jgi:flagellar operon protein